MNKSLICLSCFLVASAFISSSSASIFQVQSAQDKPASISHLFHNAPTRHHSLDRNEKNRWSGSDRDSDRGDLDRDSRRNRWSDSDRNRDRWSSNNDRNRGDNKWGGSDDRDRWSGSDHREDSDRNRDRWGSNNDRNRGDKWHSDREDFNRGGDRWGSGSDRDRDDNRWNHHHNSGSGSSSSSSYDWTHQETSGGWKNTGNKLGSWKSQSFGLSSPHFNNDNVNIGSSSSSSSSSSFSSSNTGINSNNNLGGWVSRASKFDDWTHQEPSAGWTNTGSNKLGSWKSQSFGLSTPHFKNENTFGSSSSSSVFQHTANTNTNSGFGQGSLGGWKSNSFGLGSSHFTTTTTTVTHHHQQHHDNNNFHNNQNQNNNGWSQWNKWGQGNHHHHNRPRPNNRPNKYHYDHKWLKSWSG